MSCLHGTQLCFWEQSQPTYKINLPCLCVPWGRTHSAGNRPAEETARREKERNKTHPEAEIKYQEEKEKGNSVTPYSCTRGEVHDTHRYGRARSCVRTELQIETERKNDQQAVLSRERILQIHVWFLIHRTVGQDGRRGWRAHRELAAPFWGAEVSHV